MPQLAVQPENELDHRSTPGAVNPSVTPRGSSDSSGEPSDEISFVALARTVLQRRKLFAVIPIAVMLTAALASLLVPTKYVATTTFVPGQSSSTGLPASIGALTGLANLTSQLGLGVSPDASQSPQFYASLILSRSILEKLLLSQFQKDCCPADSARLIDLMRIPAPSFKRRVEKGLKRLAKDLSVEVDARTAIVKVSAKAPTAILAATLANRVVADVGEFNLHTRQSQARLRRQFIEQRVSDARAALSGAEGALRDFYQRNREWRNSPSLFFEEGRLRRNVDVQQELYLNLQRQYETARIAEINDVPVITVIDSGVPPALPAEPKPGLAALIGLAVGVVLAMLTAIGFEYLSKIRRVGGAEYVELREVWDQARRELSGIVRRRGPRTPRHP